MGVVVEAFDVAVGVPVAIKVVRAEYAGERQWTERLAREVKLARKIQHPHVCRVFDFAQSDGRALLTMELASGGTLRSQLLEGSARARPLADRLADARAIAAGVAAIHAAGIVHRDLSPQNVLRMADGRAVVSDFGLATDAPDGTTSIHGGTVAYMAPEVLRGGRASFAADIWSLGAVIHEVVFGERLRWDPARAVMRSEVAAASLTRVERGMLEICRACTALNPERRPGDAAEIAACLSETGLARVISRRWVRRAVATASVGLVLVAGVAGARRVQSARRRTIEVGQMVDPLLIVPTGDADDWTEKSKVLADIPARANCIVALPDRHKVRFVWGYPPHAEDVDTHSGERKPSPLVANAYAEGCPDLSPDGRQLVYTGHTKDDRAFAFVSGHADGRDGVPEVQMGEPGVNSDPVWLPDGESFVYDVDDKHVAVFSMATKRSLVVPADTSSLYSSFHHVVGGRIVVTSFGPRGAQVDGFEYPQLTEVFHWRLPFQELDISSVDGTKYYSSVFADQTLVLTQVEPAMRRARFVGAIPGEAVRYPLFVEDGLAFASVRRTTTLVIRTSSAEPKRVAVSDGLVYASACGPRIIGTQFKAGRTRSVWIDTRGKVTGSFPGADGRASPRCSSDGRVRFQVALGEHEGIERCEGEVCRFIFAGPVAGQLALSVNEKRLAFLSGYNGGRVIKWISVDGVGGAHNVVDSGTGCRPTWSSDKLVWVSVRKGRRVIWTEIDTDSTRPTGRSFPGHHDCTDGLDDPAWPTPDPVEIAIDTRYQLRLLPAKYLPAG